MARLDRMHEMHFRSGQQLADQRDLGQRGAVEMMHAAGPHRAQDARLGIAFNGIEHVAGEGRDEAARRAGDDRRAQAHERLRRPLARDHGIDAG